MNNKLRSDSIFAQLTNEQTERLEDWLFEDKLGYKDVLEKMQKEFGVETSKSALARFYRRLALQRSEERRVETVALCLEGLAAKNDGTLQAGLLALANQCAIELLVEQPKSIREFATLLRALTSAGVFEMKHIEFHETREREQQQKLENERKAAEAREHKAREAEEWKERLKEINAREEVRYQKYQATRKANLAKKAAAEEAEKNAAMTNDQAPKVKTNEPAEAGIPNEVPKIVEVNSVAEAEAEKDPMTNDQGQIAISGEQLEAAALNASPELKVAEAKPVEMPNAKETKTRTEPDPSQVGQATEAGGCFRIYRG